MVMITNSFDKFPNEPTGLMYEQFGKIGLNPATAVTFEDDLSASTNWAGLSGAFSYDATNDEIDFNADTSGSSAYWNLGSTLSDTAWAMRMKVRLDTFSATSANIQNFTIGLSSTNGAYNTTQDFIGMLIRADSLGSNYKSTWGNDASQNGNTSNFTRTPSAETIYLEIIRTSATGFTVNQYSDTAYSTLLESKVVTGVTATALQYVKLTTYSEATTNNMVGAITDVKVYDGATSVESASPKVKQHFIEWFSGKQLPSYWTTTLTGATTITTQGVVDGGLGITTGASSGNGGMIDFNDKRQYAHDGSVLIGVIQRNDNLWNQFGLNANTGTFSTDWAGVQDFSSQTWVQVRSADSTGTNIDTDIAVNENASSVKIELSSSNIVVHIDGVLKVTKTTNRPRVNMQPAYRVFSETTSASKTGYIRYLEAYNT